MDKDLIQKIALDLNYPDIIDLCLSSKRMNQFVCQNEFFWINKIKKDYNYQPSLEKLNIDYPLIFEKYQFKQISKADLYRRVYIRMSSRLLDIRIETNNLEYFDSYEFYYPKWLSNEALIEILYDSFVETLTQYNITHIAPIEFDDIPYFGGLKFVLENYFSPLIKKNASKS